MNDISVIMPVIAAIGSVIILAVYLIVRGMERKERIKSIDLTKFNALIEEMKHDNADLKKDLQAIKEKVDSIDKMMKDI